MSLLGKTVKDEITGLTGVCTQEFLSMSGNLRYTVQPVSDDGSKVLDSWTLDEQGLVEAFNGKSYQAYPRVPHNLKIGQEVKGKISDKFDGCIIAFVTYLNGCTSALVQNKKGEEEWCAVQLLEGADQKVNIPETKTGGPIAKGMQQKY